MRRNRATLLFAAALLASSALLSCATRGRPPASEEERAAVDSAMSAMRDDPAGARAGFEAFLARWPESALADDAAMQLAELLEVDDPEAALAWYDFVDREHGDGEYAELARVRAAAIEYRAGRNTEADTRLARVKFSNLGSGDDRRRAYRLLADSALDPATQLRWLAQLRAEETTRERVKAVDAEIDGILRRLSVDELARAAEQIGRRVPAARVWLLVADQRMDRGEIEAAAEALDRAERLPLSKSHEHRLVAVRERLRRIQADPRELADLPTFTEAARHPAPETATASGTIGVVLPLTGPFASFGQGSLNGVLLAARVFSDPPPRGAEEPVPEEAAPVAELPDVSSPGPGLAPGDVEIAPGVRLRIRDSAGRPDLAVRAVRELAADPEVTAIVGPLVREACEAAADAADEARIPMLALTSRDEVARDRPNVFRIRTRPREEVAVLVDRAMADGAQRFAILYPSNAYGRGLRRLFWSAVEDRGGRIVGVESYEPDAVDFTESIRRLVGYTLLTDDEQAMLVEREEMLKLARRLPSEEGRVLRAAARSLLGPEGEPLPPIVDFDALFIPEYHEKVVLIAPQLAFHEAVGMRLLGPSGWYDQRLVSIGRDHVRHALVAAQFYPDSEIPFVREFADRYSLAFDAIPDSFSAQAFDATNLVLVQLARGETSRDDVRDGVLATRGYPGVTGVLSMSSDGNARKRPFLLTIERGSFRQID